MRVATACKPNYLTTNTIFLVGEREGAEGGREDGGIGGTEEVEAMATGAEGDVAQVEGSHFGRGCCVFSQTKEEEEGEADHVGNGGVGGGRGGGSNGHDVTEDGDRDRLDTVGRRVLLRVAGELALEAEVDLALHSQAWVGGPHTGERLPNAP